MKLETFFEKLDLFADAPNAVAKMRELVLELAAAGQIAHSSHVEWRQGYLKEVVQLISGQHLLAGEHNADGRGVPYLTGPSDFGDRSPIPTRWTEHAKVMAQPGDILITVKGSGVGKTNLLLDQPTAIGRQLMAIRVRGADRDFVHIILRRAAEHFQASKTGIAIPGIGREDVLGLGIPLPPLAEQKRIVAKVDELMALCDRLGAQQQERETRHHALARASLSRFAEAPTPSNLNFLFHHSFSIQPSDLRKSILTLAIQGKLVPQDLSDEPALVLLDQIAAHKAALAKQGKLRGSTVVKAMADDEVEFELPANWCWARFGDLVVNRDGERIPVSKEERETRAKTYDYYGASGVIDKIDGYLFDKPLLLIGEDGANLINRSTPIAFIARGKYWVNNHAHVLDGISEDFLQFIELHINAINLEKYVTGSAQPKMNQAKMNSIPIALPPLAEQRRIVAKVGQLMALVDQIETQLAASRTTAEKLMDVLVSEFTGTKRKPSPKRPLVMKPKTHPRPTPEPLKLSTRSFVLRRFAMSEGYRSLGKFDCTFHSEEPEPTEASPICLVGLNGSGKSNLIEALGDVFCFLELINLPWESLSAATSRFRKNPHKFELEYTIQDSNAEQLVRIRKTTLAGVEFVTVDDNDAEEPVPPGTPQLTLLPRRIIGYSSGLNETVSHPFLRTKTLYAQEVRDAAPMEDDARPERLSVFDTRTLYMDYESNQAITIANYIFQTPKHLRALAEFTRVNAVSSFGIRLNRKRARRSGEHSIVRLTGELRSSAEAFARCAGKSYEHAQLSHSFDYLLDSRTIALFRKEFKTAEALFMAMHKWSLLNALILSDEQRNVYLSPDITKGALERPPSVPPSDRVFNIVDLRVKLTEPAIEIDYSGLSDGEHQFMQVFGTALLFSEPGTLFLFDEPESHFNPQWRTQFNQLLNSLPNAKYQEYVISTHSPFIVSGSRKSNVYKFKRDKAEVSFANVDFETYGASFDVLLKKLFSLDSLIDQSARDELEKIIRSGKEEDMRAAVENFAESKEKRRLYEAIIKKEEGE